MNLNTDDELFVANLFSGIEREIRKQGGGNIDRTWAISRRFAEILAAQSNDRLGKIFGLESDPQFDTPIEIRLGGQLQHQVEAGEFKVELWLGLRESIQSVIDESNLRETIMKRENLGEYTVVPT